MQLPGEHQVNSERGGLAFKAVTEHSGAHY